MLGKHYRHKEDPLNFETTLNLCEKPGKAGQVAVAELGVQKERVERVHSLIGPRSFATPEKLTLLTENDEVGAEEKWVSLRYPKGSHGVTIQRGDKGFGVIIVEGKVQL